MRSFLEEVLPYERFSIRLPACEIPHLADTLRSIPTADVTSLQVLSCMALHGFELWTNPPKL